MSDAPIPVHLITGPLGVGKTTVIARLLADKPVGEYWLVVLNEFTDTGVDALSLAMSANGAYDLRMIPGGCLCCTGEADFRQQLSALLATDPSSWPTRILIEPSGIGHPGAIIEELRLFERSGALRLVSTVALVDMARLAQTHETIMAAQVAAADVVLLAKADQVAATSREQFSAWAAEQYPPKRFIGFSEHGRVPAAALAPPEAGFVFQRGEPHCSLRTHDQRLREQRPHEHAHAPAPVIQRVAEPWFGQPVLRVHYHLLHRHACGWQLPSELLCDEAGLREWWAQVSASSAVERCKAVVRVGIETWLLLQHWPGGTDISHCEWRQGSRIEVQLHPEASLDWLDWHARLRALTTRCPVG